MGAAFGPPRVCAETAVPPEPQSISIAAVGDIMMGSDCPVEKLPADEGAALFLEAGDILKKADVAFGNLEGPLCDEGQPLKKTVSGKSYCFRTPSRFVKNLADAGFDILSIANNHAMDFGPNGLNATRASLTGAGIKCSAHSQICATEAKGVKIACLAFSFNTDSQAFYRSALDQIRSCSKECDILIVSIHGGKEGVQALHCKNEFEYFLGEPRGNLVDFSHKAIDSGAGLILAHGPHVPRGMELYKGHMIAYSLGNFCTYGGMNLAQERAYAPLLWLELDRTGVLLTGRIYSFIQYPPGGPKWDANDSAFKLIKSLSQEDFPATNPFSANKQ